MKTRTQVKEDWEEKFDSQNSDSHSPPGTPHPHTEKSVEPPTKFLEVCTPKFLEVHGATDFAEKNIGFLQNHKFLEPGTRVLRT